MRGWLFDVSAQGDDVAVWVKTEQGMRKFMAPVRADFYARSPDLGALKAGIEMRGFGTCQRVEGKMFFDNSNVDVLRVTPPAPSGITKIVKEMERVYDYSVELFNADLTLEQRFLCEKGVMPGGWVEFKADGSILTEIVDVDEHWAEYTLPELSIARLSFVFEPTLQVDETTRVARIDANGEVLKGDGERETLARFALWFRALDPDVVVFDNEQEGYIPILLNRFAVNGVDFHFGREAQRFKESEGSSWWSYNRVVRRSPPRYFSGRWHLNSNWFSVQEGGLAGIIELARTSRQPVQKCARTSPGSAISSLQVYQAYREGYLIPYKKTQVEQLKPASHLLLADRGGFTYEPRVGLHTDCAEIDFSSLYPNIMLLHNISPETVNCACCTETGEKVPELGYWTCTKRRGLLPRILEPVIARRMHYKQLKKVPGPMQANYEARSTALKWLLVTCFGYTGYRNAKFGRIECHQSICAWAREKLLQAARVAERQGWRILHGVVDSLWVQRAGMQLEELKKLCEEIRKVTGVEIVIEQQYKWFAFVSSNNRPGVPVPTRYFGVSKEGEVKVRGIELRKHDTPHFVKRFQEEALKILAKARNLAEFRALAPQVVYLLGKSRRELELGRVPLDDLIIDKRVTMTTGQYRGKTPTRSVLEQYARHGTNIQPGEHVRFLFGANRGRTLAQKAVAFELAEGTIDPDPKVYGELLTRACESILAPCGIDRSAFGIQGQTALNAFIGE